MEIQNAELGISGGNDGGPTEFRIAVRVGEVDSSFFCLVYVQNNHY